MQNLKLIPRHLNQDSQKDGYSQSFYYDALNIKLITDEKNGYCTVSPERSSKLIYTIADHINFNSYIYIPKKILGIVEYGDIDNTSLNCPTSNGISLNSYSIFTPVPPSFVLFFLYL
jgi:hypothetical protein